MIISRPVSALPTSATRVPDDDLLQRHVDGLADTVLRLRLDRRLSQAELAIRAGLHPRHLQKLEAGTGNITLLTLTRVAVGLDVDITDLVRLRQ